MKRLVLLCLILTLVLVSCSSPQKQVATQPSLIDKVNSLNYSIQDTNNTIAQLATKVNATNGVKTPSYINFTFAKTTTGIHATLPPNSGSVSFQVILIPKSPIKYTGNYETSLKSAYSARLVSVSYIPTLSWDGKSWYVSQIIFGTGSVVLNPVNTSQTDIEYTVITPCTAYISVLEVAGGS